MRCPNCQTVNPPQAKFCLTCGNRLVVCPNCGTVNFPYANFCIECGTALTSGPTNITPPAQLAYNGHTLSAPPSSNTGQERRVVTIMFADITGSTPLADRMDPEEMRAILTGYFNLMTEQIRKHDGTVEKYIGDAVMAVFGSPIAHEDDPDRAIRAALDMQVALATFNAQRQARDPEATRLQMRIGINTGEVVAQGAQSQRLDFLITGDAVNVAARLQQVATPDTILVGERTYLSTRDVFDFRRIAPLNLRGKPDPIVAWVVQGYRTWKYEGAEGISISGSSIPQHPRGIEGLEARLVGRELELTLMHATYARVLTERHPHLITLLGAPGIGKSRLVREFIASEQEKVKCASPQNEPLAPRVLQGRCPPYGEGITYWPLIEILRSLLNMQDGDTYDTIKDRLIALVRNILLTANRTEDPEEIASAIARSIGRELDSTANRVTSIDGRELQRSTYSKSAEQSTGTRGERRGTATATQSGALQGENSQQAALLRAWRIFLEALAQQQPLILVIDDLQWADEALLDLLEYLTDRVTNVPILFLCPARPDFFERRRDWGGGRRNFTTIALESLSTEESSELINELLKTDELPDVLRFTILNRAEGNPFFVEEIVRMLIDQGVLVNEEGSWHVSVQYEAALSELASPAAPPDDTLLDQHYILPLRVPDTIQGVLAARVDLLSPVEKRILQDASIIGRTFWLSGLLKLATDMETDYTISRIESTGSSDPYELMRNAVLQILESLVQRDFIVETEKQERSPVEDDRVFSFKHVLIRDVVYNNIPRTRRSQAHAQLALWLEEQTAGRTEQFVELLAYHYQQALANWSATLADVPFSTAIEKEGLPDQASMFAAGTGNGLSNATSADHIQGIPPQVQFSRAELRRRAIRYLTMAGDQALHSYYTIRAIQAYSEALDLLNDSSADALKKSPDLPSLSRMHEKLGDAYAQRGNLDEAWQEYRLALQLTQAAPDDGIGKPAAESADLLCLYERLAELPSRWGGWFNTEPDMQEVRTYIDAGLKLLEEPAETARTENVCRKRAAFLTYQAFWYLRQMEREESGPAERAELAEHALQSGNKALDIAEEMHDAIALWITLDALGFIYLTQHKYLESHQVQHRRLELVGAISSREELQDLYYSLGWAHERISDYRSALKWFGRASHIAQTMESPSMLLISMIGRMYVWYHWNRWNEVHEVARNILQLSEQYQLDEQWQFDALETLAELAYRTGNQEDGDQYMRRCKRLIEQRHIQPELTRSIHLAREDWSRAKADFRTSVERSEPFPRPQVLATLAELVVMTGENTQEQHSLCERAVHLGQQSGSHKSLAVALRARGRLYIEQQNWEAAEQDLKQALERCEMLDLPWERGITLYCMGLLYRRRADTLNSADASRRNADLGLAHLYFEQALGFFESLKAVNDAEKVRLALAQDSAPPV